MTVASALTARQRRQLKGSRTTYTGKTDRRFGPRRSRELSPRERQVVELVVAGMDDATIATQLGLAVGTVKDTRNRAIQRLGLVGCVGNGRNGRRTDAALRDAMQKGLVSL